MVSTIQNNNSIMGLYGKMQSASNTNNSKPKTTQISRPVTFQPKVVNKKKDHKIRDRIILGLSLAVIAFVIIDSMRNPSNVGYDDTADCLDAILFDA